MPQKTYLAVLKGGVFVSFITFFFVFKNLLFPYITSKQLSFNILVEVLFAFWLAFVYKFPEWRPKKSFITFGLAAYMAVIFVSSFTGVDFNLSFWGDIERMLGVFHVFHFFLFYLIVITVMRRKEDWFWLFNASLFVAVFIAFYQLQINHSTIGNTAYVGGYHIFNFYFALFLFFYAKHPARYLYLLPIIFLPFFIYRSGVAGAYVGLAASLLIVLFLYGLLNQNWKVKLATGLILVLCVISSLALFRYHDSAFVKNNSFLVRVVEELNLNKATFQTRLLSWKAAWKDFPEHPWLGTGYGNFSITFDKYFEAKFYTYTAAETYFDRAHNNLVEIASTTGLLGLVAYLSIFIALAYYLISGFRSGKIDLNQFALTVGLVAAYFIQNLAVFDSLVTYVSLMVVLGYIYWLNDSLAPAPDRKSAGRDETYVLAAVGLIMLAVIYQYNIRPWKMLIGTIEGQQALASGDASIVTDVYKKALSYGTFLDRDSRTIFIRSITSGQNLFGKLDNKKGAKIYDYAISLADENIKYNPNDSMAQMMLAQLLNEAARYHSGDMVKFDFYSKRAEEAIDKSIALSPGRVPTYFVKAQIYLTRGDKDKALNTIRYAIGLEEKYFEGHCQLGRLLFFFKEPVAAYQSIDKCVEYGGSSSLLSSQSFVKTIMGHYAEKKDWPHLIKIYEVIIGGAQVKDANLYVEAAKIYKELGDKENAVKKAEKAMEIDPKLKDGAEKFIEELK